jgi:hypothetical protein
MKFNLHISLFITYSKIIATAILVLAFILDILSDKKGNVLMYAIPFVVFLISGKQFIDRNKPEVKPENKTEP